MKPVRVRDETLVVYPPGRWEVLRKKRMKAKAIMEALRKVGLNPLLLGSVARGDVREDSDIDVVILRPVPTYLIELAIEEGGFRIIRKEVVQPTPRHTPKAYIYLDEETSVHLPLAPLSKLEREFYWFGGVVNLQGVKRGGRVCGVNKELLFIKPVKEGHVEFSVIGREEKVAKMLGVSVDIVRERVQVLTRRDEIGRTGVFVKLVLPPSSNIETEVIKAAKKNPFLKKKIMGVLI